MKIIFFEFQTHINKKYSKNKTKIFSISSKIIKVLIKKINTIMIMMKFYLYFFKRNQKIMKFLFLFYLKLL